MLVFLTHMVAFIASVNLVFLYVHWYLFFPSKMYGTSKLSVGLLKYLFTFLDFHPIIKWLF